MLNTDLIQRYIEHTTGLDLKVNINELLAPWRTAKEAYLFKLFGENLILEKEVEFLEPKRETDCKMFDTFLRYLRFDGRPVEELSVEQRFLQSLCNTLIKDENIRLLIRTTLLTDNKTDRDITIGDFTFPAGMKIMKIFRKLRDAYRLPYFEEFRIAHSQILNTRSLKGTLCLSIHPLDYMTMSDNDCDWETCMSWKYDGCYRQGTVEMMNSENVIVAYLKSSQDMRLMGGVTWNNKKWRTLVVVNDDLVTTIKGYPYHNSSLDAAVVSWVKELCEKAYGTEYVPKIFEYYYDELIEYNNKELDINFDTEYMYNDFLNTECASSMYLNKSMFRKSATYMYNYSGATECMCCGATEDLGDSFESSDLLCRNCDGYEICSRCGDRIYDVYSDDSEELFCHYCYHCMID